MRKLIISFLAFILPLFFFSIPIRAQEEPASSGVAIPDIYPLPPTQPGFLGQDHFYTVTFRGNGEAVVALKVALTNKSDKATSEVTLRVPKVSPQEFFVYQVIRTPVCNRYSGAISYPNLQKYIDSSGVCKNYHTLNACDQAQANGANCSWYICASSCLQTGSPTAAVCKTESTCEESSEPDYYGYYWSQSKYQKAQSELSGDTLKITLPQAISSNKSGSFFVYYRALGYAKKDIFGAYQFTFETLQVEDDIRNLTVGISTDSDLVLRGATGEVQYRFEDAGQSLKAVGGVAPAESSAIDSFYNQIGYGTLVKTASSLAPLESYTVSSGYADSRLKLYAKQALIGIGIFLGLMALIVVVVKILFRKTGPKLQGSAPAPFDSKSLILGLGVSFGSALLVAGYTLLAILAVNFLARSVGYEFQTALLIFVVVISFAVYALILFAPGIYLGVKRGVGWGMATIFLTVFWMLIFLGVGLLIYLSLKTPIDYPMPIPLGGVETRQY